MKKLLVILFVAAFSQSYAGNITPDQTLWYTYPAKDWDQQALHIGNGYMGASFYGGVEQECLNIAEKTFWAGGPNVSKNYNYGIIEGGKDALPQIRKLILEGNYVEADTLCRRHMLGDFSDYGYFSAVGSLLVNFKNQKGEATDYVRSLDLANSLANVAYKVNGIKYDREYFCSYPDKTMVLRFTADQKGKLSFDIDHSLFYKPDQVVFKNNELAYNGVIFANGLKYYIRIAVIAQGGTVSFVNKKISVNSADEAVVIYTVDTEYKIDGKNYKGVDPEKETKKVIDNALKKGYAQLKDTHIRDYRNLYDRVKFTLVGNSEMEKLPTNERFGLLKSGTTDDSALKVLYFNLGRYLIISSSRPGTLPSTLQGIWNAREEAQYGGNFQSNINLQEMYWGCGPTNLPECQEGYIEWIESLVAPGRKVAEAYYGTKGWVSHATGNIWGHTSPGRKKIIWGLYPAGAAWHCRHLWQQYQYTGDADYLRNRAYPIMKEAAEFWLDNLVEKDGRLISIPSSSAEHGIQTENGQIVKYSTRNGDEPYKDLIVTVPNFQDIEMVYDLFSNVMKAAEVLGTDKDFAQKVTDARAKLPALKIGKYGQLQEWLYDYDNPRDHHRHISHMYALYPGGMISVNKNPELAEAAKISLDMRGEGWQRPLWPMTGGNWESIWRVACWTRLQDGERAIKTYNMMNSQLGYENLMAGAADRATGYSVVAMQVDASMATPGVFAEMLVQSEDGRLYLLPALPAEWPEGEIRGLLTKEGCIVDVSWEYAQLKAARITLTHAAKVPAIYVKGKPLPATDGRITVVKK